MLPTNGQGLDGFDVLDSVIEFPSQDAVAAPRSSEEARVKNTEAQRRFRARLKVRTSPNCAQQNAFKHPVFIPGTKTRCAWAGEQAGPGEEAGRSQRTAERASRGEAGTGEASRQDQPHS